MMSEKFTTPVEDVDTCVTTSVEDFLSLVTFSGAPGFPPEAARVEETREAKSCECDCVSVRAMREGRTYEEDDGARDRAIVRKHACACGWCRRTSGEELRGNRRNEEQEMQHERGEEARRRSRRRSTRTKKAGSSMLLSGCQVARHSKAQDKGERED